MRKRRLLCRAAAALALFTAGCADTRVKSDAELDLNAQQASGRQIFDRDCASCHYAYSSSGLKGPGLQHLFRKQFLPSSLPANDRFVAGTISGGRGMMPAFGPAITQQQLDDLLAYLHTL